MNNEDLITDGAIDATGRKVKFARDIVDGDADMSDNDGAKGDSDDDDEEDDTAFFLNPLLMSKNDKVNGKKNGKATGAGAAASDEEWSDDDYDSDDGKDKKKNKKQNKKDVKLGKRKDREEDHDFFNNKDIEVVPQDKFEVESDMDSDDMAETRALAKVMLRKKARTEILD